MKKSIAVSGLLILSACGGAPSFRPAQGNGALWGQVRLVRREGIKPVEKNDPVYADRRAPERELVDYRRPGFVVVYLDGQASPGGEAVISVEPSASGGAVFRPEKTAVGTGGKIVVRNACAAPCVVSCPRGGMVRELGPGETLAIEASTEGPWELFTLAEPAEKAVVFAANGPFTIAAENGEWKLPDLLPGTVEVRTWHPRFPPAVNETHVTAGNVQKIDLEVGVDNLSKEAAHASTNAR